MDANTRQVIAFHVGDRRRDSAKELWAKIPLVYREQATFHTEQYDAYSRRDSGGSTQSHHEESQEN